MTKGELIHMLVHDYAGVPDDAHVVVARKFRYSVGSTLMREELVSIDEAFVKVEPKTLYRGRRTKKYFHPDKSPGMDKVEAIVFELEGERAP